MDCPPIGLCEMELTMKQSFTLSTLLLPGGTPPAAAQSAEFASADCVTGLNEIGMISIDSMVGSLEEVEQVIARKADEQGASWYRIIQMYEEPQPDNWRAQAIIYA